MIAFLGNQEVKDLYLNRVRAHQFADELAKGKYWENGKGCAIGCTIHDSDHSKYESELGIPQWVANLEDRIFECLPSERAMTWPSDFLEAINVGSDLNTILKPMLIFIMQEAREKTKDIKSLSAIDSVLSELNKETLDLEAIRIARALAYSYSNNLSPYSMSASSCIIAAAGANAACSTNPSSIAEAIVYAADAVNPDNKQIQYIKYADKLLELIGRCQ